MIVFRRKDHVSRDDRRRFMVKTETKDVRQEVVLRVFGSTAFAFATLWIISGLVT